MKKYLGFSLIVSGLLLSGSTNAIASAHYRKLEMVRQMRAAQQVVFQQPVVVQQQPMLVVQPPVFVPQAPMAEIVNPVVPQALDLLRQQLNAHVAQMNAQAEELLLQSNSQLPRAPSQQVHPQPEFAVMVERVPLQRVAQQMQIEVPLVRKIMEPMIDARIHAEPILPEVAVAMERESSVRQVSKVTKELETVASVVHKVTMDLELEPVKKLMQVHYVPKLDLKEYSALDNLIEELEVSSSPKLEQESVVDPQEEAVFLDLLRRHGMDEQYKREKETLEKRVSRVENSGSVDLEALLAEEDSKGKEELSVDAEDLQVYYDESYEQIIGSEAVEKQIRSPRMEPVSDSEEAEEDEEILPVLESTVLTGMNGKQRLQTLREFLDDFRGNAIRIRASFVDDEDTSEEIQLHDLNPTDETLLSNVYNQVQQLTHGRQLKRLTVKELEENPARATHSTGNLANLSRNERRDALSTFVYDVDPRNAITQEGTAVSYVTSITVVFDNQDEEILLIEGLNEIDNAERFRAISGRIREIMGAAEKKGLRIISLTLCVSAS